MIFESHCRWRRRFAAMVPNLKGDLANFSKDDVKKRRRRKNKRVDPSFESLDHDQQDFFVLDDEFRLVSLGSHDLYSRPFV